MAERINIDIISSNPELRNELFRIISARYPDSYIHCYKHKRDFFEDVKRQSYSIVLIHDLEILDMTEMDEFNLYLEGENCFKVIVLTKPDYALVAKAMRKKLDDFIFISDSEQLITARLRLIFHSYIQRLKSKESLLDSTQQTAFMLDLVSARYPGAKERSKNIEKISSYIFNKMETDSESIIVDLKQAAQMIFIGRLFLTDDLLKSNITKDGAASSPEMYQYPHNVFRLLKEYNHYSGAGKIINGVFENMDGSGFPKGAKSWEIPLPSRILRIAYDFDCFINNGTMPEKAVSEIKKRSSRLYDKRMVAWLENYVNETAEVKVNEITMHLLTLEPGMQLTRDLKTLNGMKMLSAGAVLSEHSIDVLKSHTKTDPIAGHIYIKI